LLRIIDWMIQLPAAVEAAFRQDPYAFEESRQMPSVTTVERAGIEKGRTETPSEALACHLRIRNEFAGGTRPARHRKTVSLQNPARI